MRSLLCPVKGYASTDAVRKHCRKWHANWLQTLAHGPTNYCRSASGAEIEDVGGIAESGVSTPSQQRVDDPRKMQWPSTLGFGSSTEVDVGQSSTPATTEFAVLHTPLVAVSSLSESSDFREAEVWDEAPASWDTASLQMATEPSTDACPSKRIRVDDSAIATEGVAVVLQCGLPHDSDGNGDESARNVGSQLNEGAGVLDMSLSRTVEAAGLRGKAGKGTLPSELTPCCLDAQCFHKAAI
mmetsp:Transcript_22085/g.36501  ORF Transcript_22085/g.36501 Transcript_22085/m.36501 type:complete len:241 (+) Transcript_22085:475-1197(+)